MAQDLAAKTSRLIGDYKALLSLVNFIDHELEKRIVVRHCLTKLESLSQIAPQYKNELKTALGPASVVRLDALIRKLSSDVVHGIRTARNSVVGHQLSLNLEEIPDQWLHLARTDCLVLDAELDDIESECSLLDPNYMISFSPSSLDPAWKLFWSQQSILGQVGNVRTVHMPMGLWIPDLVCLVPQHHNEASMRAIGCHLMLQQIYHILTPILGTNTVYERLLTELLVIDYFSLSEAIYLGNARGNTPPLIDSWTNIGHAGVPTLQSSVAALNAVPTSWKSVVRDKIAAHIDPGISAVDLDFSRWPLVFSDLLSEIQRISLVLRSSAAADIRTRNFIIPAIPDPAHRTPPRAGAPKWINT